MVSFAAGAMLGDGFIHLLPESIAKNRSVELISFSILAGIVIFCCPLSLAASYISPPQI